MPGPRFPLVNGFRYSFASIELRIDGETYVGFKAISYTDKVERSKPRGSGRQVLGRTAGEYDAEGTLTLYREDFNELVTKFGEGWMDKAFDLVVTYSERDANTQTDTVVGCLIDNADGKNEQGTEALTTELTLNVMYIKRNGVMPVRGMRR